MQDSNRSNMQVSVLLQPTAADSPHVVLRLCSEPFRNAGTSATTSACVVLRMSEMLACSASAVTVLVQWKHGIPFTTRAAQKPEQRGANDLLYGTCSSHNAAVFGFTRRQRLYGFA